MNFTYINVHLNTRFLGHLNVALSTTTMATSSASMATHT